MRRALAQNPLALLAVPGVVRLWLAGLAAGVMRWLDMLAFSLYAFAATGSPLIVTLVALARMLPLLVLGAVAAAWAERFDRSRLLTGIFAALALLYLLLALLSLAGLMHVALVTGAAFATGLFWAFEIPVRRTMLAEVAGMARVNTSMGLEMATTQLTRLLGPLAGGALLAATGLDGVFLLGTALYGGGALLLLGLPRSAAAAAGGRRGVLGELKEGLAFVRRHGLVAAVVVSTALFNLWYLPYVALAPVVAETSFGLSPGPIGVLMAAEGMGAVAGALWVATLAQPAWFCLAYSLGGAAIAAGVLVFALAGEPILGFTALLLGGVGIAGFATMQTTLVLAAAPAVMRVRVMGVVMVAIGTGPIGFVLTGLLAEWLGPQPALACIAAFGLAAMLGCMAIWPELRRARPPEAAT
jgi:MFS family permease